MYDKSKLTNLQALQDLARRTRAEIERSRHSIADEMYQVPTAAEYRTKGNLSPAGTDGTLGTLLDLSGLTPAGDGAYPFTLNDRLIGSYTADSKLSDILADINGSDAGVTVSRSEDTGEFLFRAKETGVGGRIDLGAGLAEAMFWPAEAGGAAPAFGKAYGVPWVNNDYVSFSIPGVNGTLKFAVSSADTIEDVAGKLNNHISNQSMTASCNKYTGQLEIQDANGAAVEFEMWIDDSALGRVELEFDEDCALDIDYTPGLDGVFTAIKANGKILGVSGKTVDISRPISEAVAAAGHLRRKKAASLEAIDLTAADADQYIYMVPKTGGGSGDKYDEYLVLDGALERVGDWKVDLEGYVQAEEGMGLSSNDYTDEDRNKVAALEFATDAEVAGMLAEVFGGE